MSLPGSQNSRRLVVRRALLVVAYAVIAVLVVRTVNPSVFLAALGRIRLDVFAEVLALVAFHLCFRSLRYHSLIVRAHPVDYRATDGIRIFLLGLAVSLVTPARAGDLLKAELTRAYGIRRAVGFGIVVVERTLDLIAITGTVAVAGALLTKGTQSRGMQLGAAVLLGGLVTGTVLVTVRSFRWWAIDLLATLVGRVTKKISAERVKDISHRVFDAWDEIFTSPAVALRYFVVTVAIWLADFSKLWLILRCTGSDASLLCVLFVYPLSLIVGILTFLPFSDGVMGVTAVALLGKLAGVGVDSATAAVLVDRGISTLAPLAVYGVYALLRGTPVERSA